MTAVGTRLLFCFAVLSLGSALKCYKCSDYSGRCTNTQDCTYEDACLQLKERGGKTVRQCIRYTDCETARLGQMFPAITGFTYRCCSTSLCNSSTQASPVLGLLASLLLFAWGVL